MFIVYTAAPMLLQVLKFIFLDFQRLMFFSLTITKNWIGNERRRKKNIQRGDQEPQQSEHTSQG